MKNLLLIIFLLYSLQLCNAQTEKIEIYSNNTLLNAYFHQAEGNIQKPTLIWCHGNPGSKKTEKSTFAEELNKLNINALLFNYRGLWGTAGTFKVSNSIEDLSNVLDFIYDPVNIAKYKIDTNKIIVAGYSYGTTVVMVSALKDKRIKNIYCLGLADHNYFYFTPESLDPNNKKNWREFNQYVNYVLFGPERKVSEFKNEFNLDIMIHTYEYDFVSQAENLINKNILIVVGLNDLTAPMEYHFLPLHRKFSDMNKSNYSYKITNLDHSFKDLKSYERAKMISDWINE